MRTTYRANPERRRRWPLVIVAILLIVGAGATYFILNRQAQARNEAAALNTAPKEKINFEPATDEEKQESEQTKLDDKTPATTPAPAPAVSSSITSAKQNPTTKDIVIQTKLTGQNWQECVLTMTQGAQTVTRTAKVLFQQDFSTCMGFALRASELPSAGDWRITLTTKDAGGASNTDETTLTIVK